MIRVYDSINKKFLLQLSGHDGGVWALKYVHDGILVSGSADRTVRIWDIKRGCCTHVFKGHSSTVGCLDLLEYKNTKYVVTGSRDNTLHVWKLPEVSSTTDHQAEHDCPLIFHTPEENPYFVGVLRGHTASIRTVSGHGNIVISASYDSTLIVWDIAEMKCLYILSGHTDRVYPAIYDYERKRCISAGMDSTIRIWDLENISNNGECSNATNCAYPCTKILESMYALQGHTALVGLLKLSDKFLVSAAADGSIRVWDANDYSRKFSYDHTDFSSITACYVSDSILASGSEGQLDIYNLRNGQLVHSNILGGADHIWSIEFRGNTLVTAAEKDGQSFLAFLDFS
ncbi:SCF ubiquitin ligase complex subunit cdc4 [Saccharomyces pastorianus]|uniref:SCF ubiquitin ligase complex subunit cdc4 n=1 Tax=Saccharomyces pastorianus TaxID=27292 RepID=A0A6C1E7A6_SACPS|nr:SCF ubiquitin ligase complex subunit cdc4 [Saccharomyces pastorianus]